jgi:DNA-3-methyladenine glycosylase II
MTARISPQAAAKQLAARVPQIAAIVAVAGPIRIRPPQDSHFAALVRAITYQQLAGAAAAAIHGRLVAAPTPTAKELERRGEELRPFRSVAAWYCWRAAELYAGAAASAVTR